MTSAARQLPVAAGRCGKFFRTMKTSCARGFTLGALVSPFDWRFRRCTQTARKRTSGDREARLVAQRRLIAKQRGGRYRHPGCGHHRGAPNRRLDAGRRRSGRRHHRVRRAGTHAERHDAEHRHRVHGVQVSLPGDLPLASASTSRCNAWLFNRTAPHPRRRCRNRSRPCGSRSRCRIPGRPCRRTHGCARSRRPRLRAHPCRAAGSLLR